MLRLILIACCLQLAAGTVCDADENTNPKPEILTFLYENYPPFSWRKGDGSATGQVFDKVKLVMARAELETEWQLSTFGRMVRTVADSHRNICIAGYGYTKERAAHSWYSKVFSHSPPSGIAILRSSLPMF